MEWDALVAILATWNSLHGILYMVPWMIVRGRLDVMASSTTERAILVLAGSLGRKVIDSRYLPICVDTCQNVEKCRFPTISLISCRFESIYVEKCRFARRKMSISLDFSCRYLSI